MRRVRKLMAAIVSAALLCSCNAIPVFADPGATNESTGNGNENIEVTLQITSSYSVRLPASISLEYNDLQKKFAGSGDIEVKGIIESTKYVKVGIGDSFLLSDDFTLSNEGSTKSVDASASITSKGSTWMSAAGAGARSEDTYTLLKGYYEAKAPLSVTCNIPDEPDAYSSDVTIHFTLDDIS